MTKYQEFIEHCGVISEDKFNEILATLPEVNFKDVTTVTTDIYNLDDIDIVFKDIIDYIIVDITKYAYVDDVNCSKREIIIEDFDSIEELEKVRDLLSNWTIVNYNSIKKELEEEKELDSPREIILEKISNLPLETLQKIEKDYNLNEKN